MLVAPSASFKLRIKRAVIPKPIGSNPAKGSSYMMSGGSRTIARASATRLAMPPDI